MSLLKYHILKWKSSFWLCYLLFCSEPHQLINVGNGDKRYLGVVEPANIRYMIHDWWSRLLWFKSEKEIEKHSYLTRQYLMVPKK